VFNLYKTIVSSSMWTTYGNCEITAFERSAVDADVAITFGQPKQGGPCLLRVQSHCLPSIAFGTTMCDCALQLEKALRMISQAENGLLIYLNQEGRGYGLASKVQIMSEVAAGKNIVAAQMAVGRTADQRDYKQLPIIIERLGITGPLTLLSDNPKKIEHLKQLNLNIVNTVRLNAESGNSRIAEYLFHKKQAYHDYIDE
jgi:3,4-dihydroxy 2-butanone 4-phosphate synthase/GTP cyclohydrolase II